MSNKKKYTVYLTEETVEVIKRIAAINKSNLSAFIDTLLEKIVNDMNKEGLIEDITSLADLIQKNYQKK